MNFHKIDKELSNLYEELATIRELDTNTPDFDSVDNEANNINYNDDTEYNNANEVNRLKDDLNRSENARKKLSIQIDKMIEGSQKTMKYYQESISLMNETLKENERTHMRMEDELSKLRKEFIVLAINKEILENDLNELHGINETESLISWMETKEIRTSLQNSEKKIEELYREIQNLKTFKTKYDERELLWRNETKALGLKLQKLEQEKEEAVATFEKLSTYFSEKNMVLKRKLKEHEEFWLSNPCDETILQQMEILRKENLKIKRLLAESKRINHQKDDQLRKLQRECEQKDIENSLLTMKSERKIKSLEMETAGLCRKLLEAESKILNEMSNPHIPSTSVLPADIDYAPTENNSPLTFFTCANPFYQREVKIPFSLKQEDELEQDVEEEEDEEIPVNIKPEGRPTETCVLMPNFETLFPSEIFYKSCEVTDTEHLPFPCQQNEENELAAEDNQELGSGDETLPVC